MAQEIVQDIPVNQIVRDIGQPRQEFAVVDMEELVDSIRHQGIKTPLTVRPYRDGYVLTTGERRLQAAIALGLSTVPCLVRDIPLREVLTAQLLENLPRKDLQPIELVRSLYLIWLSANIEALIDREGAEIPSSLVRTLEPDVTPAERIANLEDLLCEWADVESVGAYAQGGAVLVGRKSIAQPFGLADRSDTWWRNAWKLLDLDATVITLLSGEDVSQATLRTIADMDNDDQVALVQQAKASKTPLTEALKAAKPKAKPGLPVPTDDEDLFPQDADDAVPAILGSERKGKDDFVPDPQMALLTGGNGTAPKLITNQGEPQRGSVPPAGHGQLDANGVELIRAALQAFLDILDAYPGAVFSDAQRTEFGSPWNELKLTMDDAFGG